MTILLARILCYSFMVVLPTPSKVIFSSRYSLNVYGLNFSVIFHIFGRKKNNYFSS